MHLGGKMISNAIINATDEVRCEFLSKINQEVDEAIKSKEFVSLLRMSVGDQYVDLIDKYQKIEIDEQIYNLSIPRIVKEEHHFAFKLLYQSVRLAALLHDVGHPPFSHITEFALKDIWKHVKEKSDNDLTSREKTFLDATSFYAEDADAELHEQIGIQIANRLVESVTTKDSKPRNMQEAQTDIFYKLVNRFMDRILREDGKLFEEIHSVIAASIDCDRLDYISRDMISSGFNVGVIEYDRLISSIKMIKRVSSKDVTAPVEDFLFCTDIRTVTTVEDYFHRRWNLYKNVIFHHRVVKTDFLLGKAITTLAMDYLEKKDSDSEVSGQALPLDISGLWRAITQVRSHASYFNALIQWDDSWLISVLRQQYFEKYISENDSMTKYQMEEFLSNRKNYRSMIKKMDAFFEIDKQVLNYFNSNLDEIERLFNQIEQSLGFPWPLLNKIKEQVRESKDEDWSVKAPSQGFVLTRLKEVYDTIYPHQFEQVIKKAVAKVSKNYSAIDSLVVFKRPKTGLEKNFPSVHSSDEAVLLDKVSRIKTDLRSYQTGFPIFFIYIFENSEVHIPHKVYLQKVGEEIVKLMVTDLNEKMTQSATA
jgi:HD superfamily phosphohydrolase